MFWLLSLLLFETVLEGLLCNGVVRSNSLNRTAAALSALALLVCTLGLALLDWRMWVWLAPLTLYRLINLLRLGVRRLPQPHLNSVSLRAFKWLVISQFLVVASAATCIHFSTALTALDVLVAIQLLGALVLLRASTHTWQHAHASDAIPRLSDKELPTLSVLVPARNETDELERCLDSLVASDYPKLEIIVLDDNSTNRRTPEIIRSFAQAGVRFVRGQTPEEDRWLAKNFAYAQLSHEASGELLLFCGVDALFAPDTIRRLVEQLYARNKTMLSVMPLRRSGLHRSSALLQAMRYYWEICLPRRFFKRPPVLSTCWLVTAQALDHMGGFEAVSRSVTPEAPFARQSVTTDSYAFIRSDEALGLYSDKPASEQYNTSVRVRYPQMHRRLELVALAAFFELVFLLGPVIGLLVSWRIIHTMAYVAMWAVALACLLTTYGLIAVGARLTNGWSGWLLFPVACIADLIILHISLWKYEFGTVEWKGRSVSLPVMQTRPTTASSPADSV
jgi:hypothetical protein